MSTLRVGRPAHPPAWPLTRLDAEHRGRGGVAKHPRTVALGRVEPHDAPSEAAVVPGGQAVDRDAAKRVVLRQYVAGLPMGSRYQLCRGNRAPGCCVDDSPARWVNRRLHPFGVAPLRDNFELEC